MEERHVKPESFWESLRSAQDDALAKTDNVAVVRARMPLRTPRTRVARPWFVAIAAALTFAAAATIWIGAHPAREGAITFVVGNAAARGRLGDWIDASGADIVPLRFSDGSSVDLAPGSQGRVTETVRDGVHMLLERGGAEASVVHRDTTHWRIDAGPFQIAITGTRFAVRWDPAAEVLGLEMHEGHVVVTGAFLREPIPVSSGQILNAFCKEARAEVADARAAVAPERALVTAPASSVEAPADRASRPGPLSPKRLPLQTSWQELALRGEYRDALDAAERLGFEAECRRASGKDLLLLGDAARLVGYGARAQQAYLAARERIAGGDRTAYAIGLVAFDGAHDYAEAAKWFETYLRENATGPLRREAAGRLLEALQRSGQTERASQFAQSYLAEYPSGPHAPLARQLASR
jgi:transmembrane sensor